MRKFTDVLEEYLQERDRQNSDYYDGKYLGMKLLGEKEMQNLADELNQMIEPNTSTKE